MNYSNDDILKMKNDAEMRVKEMKTRSQFIDEIPPLNYNKDASKKVSGKSKIKENDTTKTNNMNQSTKNISCLSNMKNTGIKELLKMDNDRILLTAILVVLYSEKADELLMLAILYIMM